MKTFTHLLYVLILSIVLFACNNVHFLKEESYQNQVAQDFEQKKQALPHGDLFAIFADSILSVYEREALMFSLRLYADRGCDGLSGRLLLGECPAVEADT